MSKHLKDHSSLPKLRVTSNFINIVDHKKLEALVRLADPDKPLLWLRDQDGLVGFGETLKLEFRGEDRFETASKTWKNLVSKAEVFDAVRKPSSGLSAFASFTFDDDSEQTSVIVVPEFIVAVFDEKAWLTVIEVSDKTDGASSFDPEFVASILARATELQKAPVASFVEPPLEAQAYREGVALASDKIARGEAEKIVLARRLTAAIPEGDTRAALLKLATEYLDCWTFAVDGMIGSSPETLIRSVNGQVSARVLAGTRKRALDSVRDEQMKQELIASEKERFEHRLAVESLIDTLSPFVVNLETEADPHILKLPNVWHLATDVRAELDRGADAIQLAGAVHPTAAVAGTPTPVAIKAIAELEPFDRGRYAGAVGWIDANGDGDFAIALRSAQLAGSGDSRTITAFAGGGLVAGSDPWHELTETVAKFRPIIEAFS